MGVVPLMDRRLTAVPPSADEAALLQRIARGDRAALAALFEAQAGRLLGVALRIVRRRDLAEEVIQDSFVSIWQSAARFDPARGSARGWLVTIVRNRALNLVRDGARLDLLDPDALAEIGDRRHDALSAYRDLPDSHALRRCLGLLDERKREAILLAYVVGMSHGEVAGQLGAPLGTVKAWIRRGTTALQECLS
jgi:RNA polymerase sigma-70 factor (ECF subfamily)